MSSPIQKPIARQSNGRSFDELAGTNHGNSSKSTRNRLPVQRQARQASEAPERLIPVKVDLRRHGSKNKSSNTATAQWSMTKTKRGGKRKKGKTQKKRKSTKKRNNRKRI